MKQLGHGHRTGSGRAPPRRIRQTHDQVRHMFPHGQVLLHDGLVMNVGHPQRVDAALRRLAAGFETLRISPELAIVRSRGAASATVLVRQALTVRTAWGLRTPADRWPRVIASVDRSALRR